MYFPTTICRRGRPMPTWPDSASIRIEAESGHVGIGLPRRQVVVGKYMVVQVGGSDADPQVTDADVIAAGRKQLLDQSRSLGGVHADHVLGAAPRQGLSQSRRGLVRP